MVIALLLVCFGSSCTSTVVLDSDDVVYVVKDGQPTFNQETKNLDKLEGWLLISPGNAAEYLKWLAEERRKKAEAEVPDSPAQ